MALADLSGIAYFLPIASFLIVFIVGFAVIAKTKLFESQWLQLLTAFIISVIFVSVGGAQEFVQDVTPWFAVLLVSFFFILLLMGLAGKELEKAQKGIGIVFIVLFFIVFIISGLIVFSSAIVPYLPSNIGYSDNETANIFFSWLYSSRVAGAILLIVISALVSWFLVKSNGKDK